jgi:hypothetical protein
VTVFHPVGSVEDVEVEVVGADVVEVFELVVPEHAAKPTLHRQATPTNIHRTVTLTYDDSASFPVGDSCGDRLRSL